jgi:peptidoglycan hydrolase-like protein with peptidoglycan-binding domain
MSTQRLPFRTVVVLAFAVLLGACSSAAEQSAADRPAPHVSSSPTVGAPGEPKPVLPGSSEAPDGPTTPAATPTPTPSRSAAPDATPSPAPTPSPTPTAEPPLPPVGDEDTGADVRALQHRLDELGYAPGPVDGIYGERTTESVAAYQHAAGLDVTGQADRTTVAGLERGDHEVTPLAPGDTGEAVRRLQETLASGPLDPGAVDGVYGEHTRQAVYALEKLAGVAVDGVFDGTDRHAIDRVRRGEVGSATHNHDRRWVEVDLSRQLMAIYDANEPETPLLVSHVSTGNGDRWCNDTAGCRVAQTPTGSFTISRRIDGWRESSLDIGRLYNPLYFRGGVALHGALSVPNHPASHGCVRVPMHIAEYLPELLPNSTPVEVFA